MGKSPPREAEKKSNCGSVLHLETRVGINAFHARKIWESSTPTFLRCDSERAHRTHLLTTFPIRLQVRLYPIHLSLQVLRFSQSYFTQDVSLQVLLFSQENLSLGPDLAHSAVRVTSQGTLFPDGFLGRSPSCRSPTLVDTSSQLTSCTASKTTPLLLALP